MQSTIQIHADMALHADSINGVCVCVCVNKKKKQTANTRSKETTSSGGRLLWNASLCARRTSSVCGVHFFIADGDKKEPCHQLSSRAGGIEQGGIIFCFPRPFLHLDNWHCLLLACCCAECHVFIRLKLSTRAMSWKNSVCHLHLPSFAPLGLVVVVVEIIAHDLLSRCGCDGRQSAFDSVFGSGQFRHWIHSSIHAAFVFPSPHPACWHVEYFQINRHFVC